MLKVVLIYCQDNLFLWTPNKEYRRYEYKAFCHNALRCIVF